MKGQMSKSSLGSRSTKNVVHARIGAESCEVLEELAKRQGVSHTQALRNLLDDAREHMAEDAFGSRLDALARTLAGVIEQQARHATRIEAMVAILRKVEEGQVDREGQILQTLAGVLALHQLTYAHLLGIVESSPRAAEITTSAQAKIRILQGEG
jgi:hypothetical protein